MARPMNIRPATHADLPALHAVIERADRGDSARQGWTFEADLRSDDARGEPIACYQRRGYALTDETRPFPILTAPPLSMVGLAKSLAAPAHLG